MKKIPGWLWAIIIIAILIVSKYVFFPKKEDNSPASKTKSEMPVVVNYVIAAKERFNDQVYSSGRADAFNQIEVKPEISGKIIALLVQEGQEVKKGTLLVKLNDADLQAQLAKNKVQQKQSEQKLERLKKLIQINGVSTEELEIQENELEMLKADMAFIQAQIQKTNVVAAFDGVVGLKQVSEGEMVTVNQPLFNLVQLKSVFIEFSIPEKYAAFIKKGMEVNFETDTKISTPLKATVYAIEPKIDESVQALKIRAMYQGSQSLIPGSFVKVFTQFNDSEKQIMIPTLCIIPVLKGQKTYLVKQSKAYEVKVKTGLRSDNMIQILDGIMEGDTVISSGLMTVKDGAMVKLIKQKKQ